MLPTKEKAVSDIVLHKRTNELRKLVGVIKENPAFTPQHIYVFSEEKVKKGDWYYSKGINSIFQAQIFPLACKDAKKIIATNDTSLITIGLDSFSGAPSRLPQPSPEFISVFIREYNKGNIITDVMVEYTSFSEERGFVGRTQEETELHLKVDKNNYITITKVKDDWSKSKVEELIESFISYHKMDKTNPITKAWLEHNELTL